MKTRIPLPLFVCLMLGSLLPVLLPAQQWQRDSIYIQGGVPGTSNFTDSERVYFEAYDDDDRPLQIRTQRRDEMGEWVNWRRRTYTYTEGELTQLLVQRWRPTVQAFGDAAERSYTYDAEGNMLSKLVKQAPSPGMPLENHRQWTYTYDNTGNPISRLLQRWDGAQWTNVSRLTTSYNAEDQPTQQLQERWIDGSWANNQRRGWLYDDDTGLVTAVLEQGYNAEEQSWENRNRVRYENNGVASWTDIIKQRWNVDQMSWVNVEREELQLGAGLQLESRTLAEWQEDAWQPLYQLYYSFAGSVFSLFGDSWNTDADQWDPFARHQAIYEDGRIIQDRGWQYWNAAQEKWLNQQVSLQRQHFWSDVMVSTEAITTLESCPIPNPYRMGTPFFCEGLPADQPVEVLLADVTGRIVYRQRLNTANTIQLNGTLPGGLYVLVIQQPDQRLHVQKLVITP